MRLVEEEGEKWVRARFVLGVFGAAVVSAAQESWVCQDGSHWKLRGDGQVHVRFEPVDEAHANPPSNAFAVLESLLGCRIERQ
jgi:hypothetical protein